MADVVSLRGDVVVPPSEPHPDVVELAEGLLRRAQSGDLRGLVVSMHHADGAHSWASSGRASLATIGNLAVVQSMLIHVLDHDVPSEGGAA